MSAAAPAICDTCGTVFPSGFELGPGASVRMVGNKSGPCPKCGGMGSIPDGLYEFTGETLKIVTNWAPARQQRFTKRITAAQRVRDRPAAERAITREPELRPIAQRYLIPRNAGEFWTMIAALLTVISLATGQLSSDTTVYNTRTTNIEQITEARGPPTAKPKPPPRPPKRAKPKRKRKRSS